MLHLQFILLLSLCLSLRLVQVGASWRATEAKYTISGRQTVFDIEVL